MKKKIIIVLLILIVAAFAVYKFLYKEHRDIASEDVTYTETVVQVFDAFQKDAQKANAKYLDKTIEISGNITNIDPQNKLITVDEKLSAKCTNSIPNNLKPQNSVILKGRVVGYDDLLGEIQMDQCTIKK
ncbi:OB-fold protein [Flavobacterium wongokense]|uniref:OB-fold protein n=1 Tax=Flavobacterium wongokense TaxID=2910674 RepID=UPI001F1BDA8E|nr:hypothetical protein [Flavobacterium sp. WG47]MCF6132886.1 hypothetical protein [Flavobacterium sp. WG47]